MRYFALFIFLSSILLALDLPESSNIFVLKNHTIIEEGNSDYISDSELFNRTSIEYRDRYIYDSWYLDIDLEGFHHNSNIDNYKNTSLSYSKRNDIQYNSVMLAYSNDIYGFYGGVIPFRGSRFSEFKNPLRNGGNGIELLIDQVFVGGFGRVTIDNFDFIYGEATWRRDLNYNSLGYNNNDKSDGAFTIIKTNVGKNYLEFNYFSVTAVMDSDKNPIDYADIELYGLGYIYDDSFKSGMSFSLELGMSESKEDNAALAASNAPGVPLTYLRSIGYNVDSEDNRGYAWKTNIKYENEINDTEYFIGCEYFKTYNNWLSMNHGVLFLSNNSWWQLRNGRQYTVYGGLHISKNLLVQLRYSRAVSDSVPEYFSISSSTNISESPNPSNFFTETDRVELEISLHF